MTILYRPVQVTREGQREALPPGSFPRPDCREGGILTYLVPIEAEEEILDQATHASPGEQLRRYVTRWQRFTAGGTE